MCVLLMKSVTGQQDWSSELSTQIASVNGSTTVFATEQVLKSLPVTAALTKDFEALQTKGHLYSTPTA